MTWSSEENSEQETHWVECVLRTEERGSGIVLDRGTKVRRHALQLREIKFMLGNQIIKHYYNTMDMFLN